MRDPIALLVRHGHDTLSDAGVFVGWLDVELTEKGMDEGQKAADFISKFDIKTVYSSPLIRCVQMSQIFVGDKKLKVSQDRGLLPFNRGILTGTREEVGKPALQLFLDNPSVQIPGGESRIQAEQRIEGFFKGTLKDAEKKPSVFFTHHSVIDILNEICLGKRTPEPTNLVKPGGVVGVYLEGDGYKLEALLNKDDTTATIS